MFSMSLDPLTTNHHHSKKEMTESSFLLRKQLRLKHELGWFLYTCLPRGCKTKGKSESCIGYTQHRQHVCLMPLSGYQQFPPCLEGCLVS